MHSVPGKYISKLINCSIIVVSQQPTAPMKKTLLKQLIEQYGENYKMTLDILHLDGSIKHSDVGLDNPTEIRDLSQDEECMNILTLDTKLGKDEESHSMNIYIGSMSTVQLNRELDDAPQSFRIFSLKQSSALSSRLTLVKTSRRL